MNEISALMKETPGGSLVPCEFEESVGGCGRCGCE